MNLKEEDVQEFVKFFEKYSQYWKKSIFLDLIAENKALNKEVERLKEFEWMYKELAK